MQWAVCLAGFCASLCYNCSVTLDFQAAREAHILVQQMPCTAAAWVPPLPGFPWEEKEEAAAGDLVAAALTRVQSCGIIG